MDDIDKMADAIKQGIDNNGTDAPALSIDPDTKQVSVVGDPNKISESKGAYSITFIYPGDMLSPEDKAKMRKVEDSDEDEYITTVKYTDCRVKPLYRTKIAVITARILTTMGVVLEDGSYTTESVDRRAASAFLDHIGEVAEIAKLVLDIPEDQVQYIDPDSLVVFFVQMLNNEPNIIKESISFLEPSVLRKVSQTFGNENETNQSPSTPQN